MFGILITSFAVAGHLYLYLRLVHPMTRRLPVRVLGAGLLLLLTLLLSSRRAVQRQLPEQLAEQVGTAMYVWLGTAGCIVLALMASDALRILLTASVALQIASRTRIAKMPRMTALELRPLLSATAFIALLTSGLACKEEATAPTTPERAPAMAPSGAPVPTTPLADAPPAQAKRDPCELISAADVKTATGIEAEGKPSRSGGASVCTWMGADGKSAIVQIFPTEAHYDKAKSAFEAQYKGTSDAVQGMGDKAFVITGNTGPLPTATYVAQKGSTPISVQVMALGGDTSTLKSQAETLAQTVIGKL